VSDEVRDMIRSALADEPGLGLEFEQVVADGRRRRARRRFGALTAVTVGIVAVVGVSTMSTGTPSQPAGLASTVPTTAPPPANPGCVVPKMTGGFPDQPRGTASPDELAESGRLTEAFKQFTLPLPAGVEAGPLELCVVRGSWGGTFTVTGDRSVTVYVRQVGGQPPGECVHYNSATQCSTRTLPDGSTARVIVEPMPDATLVSADVWRTDGTYVHVMETGSQGSTTRVLNDDQLIALGAAPQLRVQWTGRSEPAAPSDRRAAELDPVLAGALPPGVRAEPIPGASVQPLEFRISQGGYRAMANLFDAAGGGWLMVNVEKPGDGEVTCGDRATCEIVELSDGRKAAVESTMDGGVTRLFLNTKAADGTGISIHATNAADTGTGPAAPTRPSPPLTVADLVRIAELPDLHW
jgi:hypothetical protein